ncbi:MAG: hypothetical protein COV55_02670 [Candidatus Komeilibacteria bacterium CG11_big_fil_rev_8_21_14_0_20_36_20]|uniref:Uncharacterized protein n=1 Tax=Candidatus Komeilibacteria bacterium CG11_big_fil_rev_8_21_14_0_20_36_20 TaxID=1974477 RepID=A0A2H0NCV2_9BACT|nr:MAG: hypothetical protein COV55_02670 [Candidatus Komeilibacteria bacterium CG11_big_fil_rev_8_21_14_0_20_36_20]PIR81493.1 MAG: hypothetical protein COU21_03240 [Candidatus Komeilibacteria bacterium CG10_big_fil_rev_8_21_14_0_10_36_65]PJC55731.1 MAG: hypothetical protein CO027_00580 [Candidatus Komeilibacteria bacterium CG_4_9_14_0_2_um_filter_36_13]
MAKKKKEEEKREELEETPESLPLNTEDYGQVFATWEFPEFEKPPRNKWWYLAFAVAAILLLIFAYFSKNYLFAIIIVLFLVIYIINEKKEMATIQTILTEDGILINDKLIEYKDIQNFYIVYLPPEIKNLYLQPKNSLKQRITLPLQQQNPVEIRQILLQYLDEDLAKEDVPNSENISRILRL